MSGRRPGQTTTRQTILLEARKLFAERGYDRTTMRGIATIVGVDPALISYFFKTKQQLFVEAVLPIYGPLRHVPQLLDGDISEVGRRLANYFVSYLEDPEGRKLVLGLVRACLSERAAAEILKKLFIDKTGAMLSKIGNIDHPELRANLVGTQFIGLVMLRHVVKVEPLASAPKEAVIDSIAPTLQRYITGSLNSGL